MMFKPKLFISEREYKELKYKIEQEKGYEICGYPIQTKEGVSLCKLPAGAGTTHPGVGRCMRHGGNCGPKDGSGLYGYQSSPFSLFRIINKYEHDTHWESLEKELATARGILESIMNRVAEGEKPDLGATLATLKTIADLVEKRIKIEERNSYSIEDIKLFLKQIVEVINTTIKDFELRKELLMNLQKVKLLRLGKKEEE